MTLGELECPSRVSMTKEHGISATSIYQDCVLDIFRVPYLIDLIPILMGDECVTVGIV